MLFVVPGARRRHEHDVWPGPPLLLHLADDLLAAIVNGLGVHHHAAAAAIRVIVRLFLLVQGVIPNLMAMRLNIAPLGGPPDDALGEEAIAHLRE